MCAHLPRLGRTRPTRPVLTISRVGHHDGTSHGASYWCVGRGAGAPSMSGFCGDDDRICRKTLVSSVFDSRFRLRPACGFQRIVAVFCARSLSLIADK